MFLAVEQHYQL